MILQRLALRAAVVCALLLVGTIAEVKAGQLTVVLICPATFSPSDCTRETADDVLIGAKATTPFPCLMGGMMMAAHRADGEGHADHYALTRCEGRPD